MTNYENSESTLKDFFISRNEENSNDEIVIDRCPCFSKEKEKTIPFKSPKPHLPNKMFQKTTQRNRFQTYIVLQKQVFKPKPLRKPFENRFQDITCNYSSNFKNPLYHKATRHF